MKLAPDDPRLTAYALGELDEHECAAVETALRDSTECRQAVEEIRQMVGVLESELRKEPMPALSKRRRKAVLESFRKNGLIKKLIPFPTERRKVVVVWAAMAASLALLFSLEVFRRSVPSEVEMTSPQANSASASAAASLAIQPAQSLANGIPGGQGLEAGETVALNLSMAGVSYNGLTTDLEAMSAATKPATTFTIIDTDSSQGFRSGSGGSLVVITDGLSVSDPLATLPSLRPSVAPSIPNPSVSWGGDGFNIQPKSVQFALSDGGDHSDYVLPKREQREAKELEELAALAKQPTTASYPRYLENAFTPVAQEPLSTFSIDVDTASYANVRRFLNSGQLPPRDAVRIEEMLNYFAYRYPQPKGDAPFSANLESAVCPWQPQHRLVRVALKGRELAQDKRPPSNFVFLIDVSGSMQPAERLPLIKQGLRMLVKRMNAGDRVALVVYASSSGMVLASTSCEQKEKILEAIERLEAGGSTNGGEGIQRAYDVAAENFIKGGVNRVILCTDGDFNVGITDQGQLLKMIEQKAKGGVFLTTLGVGTDNLQDSLMQRLADKGNGNYHYLDSVEEAHKVLVEQMNSTLVTIAKDVKIQIEFNPAQVSAYRLVGYEKRLLRKEDFNNDKKDAGEIGAGHTVTALYEVVPAGVALTQAVDNLKYQPAAAAKPERYTTSDSKEMLTLKLRYKQPEGDTSKLLEFPFTDTGASYSRASADFKFASAVAAFGMILKDSAYKGSARLDTILELAEEAKGEDKEGYRAEFIQLVKKARSLGTPEAKPRRGP
jgi:Ca-activated chloride channel family protein